MTRYRAYNSALARWINRDPIEEGGGINLYAYVRNCPTMWIDPSGKQGILIPLEIEGGEALAAAIAAAIRQQMLKDRIAKGAAAVYGMSQGSEKPWDRPMWPFFGSGTDWWLECMESCVKQGQKRRNQRWNELRRYPGPRDPGTGLDPDSAKKLQNLIDKCQEHCGPNPDENGGRGGEGLRKAS
jgi:uncharacterized protein RhaS with RHS repeats